jgi:deoxyadenosine kinase
MADAARPLFIGIAGIIGAGKSSLTRDLAAAIPGAVALYEPVDNPYLEAFYRDRARYAFEFQVFMLQRRFEQHREAAVLSKSRTVVQDRTLWEDTVFAQMMHDAGYISDQGWQTYLALFRSLEEYMVRPDAIFYLDVEPDLALERVRQRDRGAEQGLELEYLVRLRDTYEQWIAGTHDLLNIVRVSWRSFCPATEFLPLIARATTRPGGIAARWGRHL